ncbi:MAG: putative oligopeptide transporter substrate binding protein [Candidatus Peribacteria bacterium]|nr:putative oligopeptide transporter substrate binding protein [Candidatus Peribacteria bacterium]
MFSLTCIARSIFGTRTSSVRKARRAVALNGIENLEGRQLMAARLMLTELHLPAQEVQTGARANLGSFRLTNPAITPVWASSLKFTAATGTDGTIENSLSSIRIYADMNGNGTFDNHDFAVAKTNDPLNGGTIRIPKSNKLRVTKNHPVTLGVDGIIADEPDSNYLGLSPSGITANRRHGKPVKPSEMSVTLLNSPGLAHIIEPPLETEPQVVMAFAGPGTATAGGNLTYMIGVFNIGQATAHDMTVTYEVPNGLSFTNASSGNFLLQGNLLTGKIASLEAGAQIQLDLHFHVNSDAVGQITSNVDIEGSDILPVTAGSSVTTTIKQPETQKAVLTVSMLASQLTVPPGDFVQYTGTIQNTGSATANQVNLSDTVPAGLMFEPSISSNGSLLVGNHVQTPNFELAPGQMKEFFIGFRVSSNLAQGTVITNSVIVGANNAPFVTSNTANISIVGTPPQNYLTLTTAAKAMASEDTVVQNQKNVPVFTGEFYAAADSGSPKDILVTGLSLTGTGLGNGQHYTFWVDTDGDFKVDTIVQTGVTSNSNSVDFTNLKNGGYVVPAEETVRWEIHTDINSSASGNLHMTSVVSTTAEELSTGTPLRASQTPIVNNGVTGTNYTIRNQGDLYVTKDTTPIREQYGLLGSTVILGRLRFHAKFEAIAVTDLHFTTVAGLGQSIDRIELYKGLSQTAFASATIGAAGADEVPHIYNGQPAETLVAQMEYRQLVISDNQDEIVTIVARLKTDVAGGKINEPLQFVIVSTPVSNNSTGEGAIRARGDVSSNNLLANNGNATADGEVFIGRLTPAPTNQDILTGIQVTTASMITAVTNANPDGQSSNSIPSGKSRAVGQFKFTAAPNNNSKNGLNKVRIDELPLILAITGREVDADRVFFYNKADAITHVQGHLVDANGNTLQGMVKDGLYGMVITTSDDISRFIEQGTDQTFVVELDINVPSSPPIGSASLQVSLDTSKIKWTSLDNSAATTASYVGLKLADSIVKSTLYQS